MITTETVSKYINKHFSCSDNCKEYDIDKITLMINEMVNDGVLYGEYDKQQLRQSLVFSISNPITIGTGELVKINNIVDFIASGEVY